MRLKSGGVFNIGIEQFGLRLLFEKWCPRKFCAEKHLHKFYTNAKNVIPLFLDEYINLVHYCYFSKMMFPGLNQVYY